LILRFLYFPLDDKVVNQFFNVRLFILPAELLGVAVEGALE